MENLDIDYVRLAEAVVLQKMGFSVWARELGLEMHRGWFQCVDVGGETHWFEYRLGVLEYLEREEGGSVCWRPLLQQAFRFLAERYRVLCVCEEDSFSLKADTGAGFGCVFESIFYEQDFDIQIQHDCLACALQYIQNNSLADIKNKV